MSSKRLVIFWDFVFNILSRIAEEQLRLALQERLKDMWHPEQINERLGSTIVLFRIFRII